MFGFVGQALGAIAAEGRRQGDIRALNELSDYLLDDIGLRREQLPTLGLKARREAERPSRALPLRRPELVGCG